MHSGVVGGSPDRWQVLLYLYKNNQLRRLGTSSARKYCTERLFNHWFTWTCIGLCWCTHFYLHIYSCAVVRQNKLSYPAHVNTPCRTIAECKVYRFLYAFAHSRASRLENLTHEQMSPFWIGFLFSRFLKPITCAEELSVKIRVDCWVLTSDAQPWLALK